MRTKRILAAAIAAPLLALGLAGCTTTTVKCSNNSCDVSVKTDDAAEVEVFDDYDLWISDLVDGSVTVAFRGEKVTLKQGESGNLDNLTVQATKAVAGEAKLKVTQ